MALRGFKRRLVDNSIDAYVLSLETINRLSVEYRLESFCMLLCNAWELLLKARIVQIHGRKAIYYPRKRGSSLRTLSGKDCSEKVFPNANLDIRMNLEKVIDLRDECTHLVIAKVPADILELLQSCVLNYHKCLIDWFDISLNDRVPVGMMTIVYEFAPLTSDMAMLRKDLGAEEVKFLTKFQAEIRREAWILGSPKEYVAQVDHRVLVINKAGQADVKLIGGEGGAPVHIVEKPKDPAKTHPYYEADIITRVKSMIPQRCNFNSYSFQSICHAMNAKNRPEWYFKLGLSGARSQFSDALAHEIAKRINDDSGFIERSREEYSSWKRSQGHFGRKQK